MKFTELISLVNKDKRLVPDLMKAENGNNFRAISESAILDVIEPILTKAEVYYVTHIKEQHLDIREAFGSKGKKLQFIASITIQVVFKCWDGEIICNTESVGMGIDDNDKAMGKAYTYALKYALLKLFRLRYADDPDFKASEPLHTEKPKEKELAKEVKKNSTKGETKGKKTTAEQGMSEKQRDYILGMMKKKGITDRTIMDKFDGYEPHVDEYIPMTVARAMINFLEEQDDLPF